MLRGSVELFDTSIPLVFSLEELWDTLSPLTVVPEVAEVAEPVMKMWLAKQPAQQNLEGVVKFAGHLQGRSLRTDARTYFKRFQPKLGKTDNFE